MTLLFVLLFQIFMTFISFLLVSSSLSKIAHCFCNRSSTNKSLFCFSSSLLLSSSVSGTINNIIIKDTVTKKISYPLIRQGNNHHLSRSSTTTPFLPLRRTFTISNVNIGSIMDHNQEIGDNNDDKNNPMEHQKQQQHDEQLKQQQVTQQNDGQKDLQSNMKSRFVYGKDDALFHYIEQQHHNRDWGDILDSGTGLHSIRWLSSLLLSNNNNVTSLTAITADKSMRISVQNELNDLLQYISTTTQSTSTTSSKTNRAILDDKIQVLIGNWFPASSSSKSSSSSTTTTISESSEIVDHYTNINNTNNNNKIQRLSLDEQLKNQLYDTIIADYLIGSIDGFSPYKQCDMIYKLISYLKSNHGRLYIVSLQPIPDNTSNNDPITNIICQIVKVRDACILLAGQRCYREYPIEWMIQQLETISKICSNDNDINNCIDIVSVQRFPIYYTYNTILKQINVGRSKLKYMKNISLQISMKQVLDDYDKQCQTLFNYNNQVSTTRHVQFGFDYVIVVEKKMKMET